MGKVTIEQRILGVLRSQGGIATHDALWAAVPTPSMPGVLGRMVRKGLVERSARGVYKLPGHDGGLFPEFVEAIAQAPHAAVGLASALAYHGLTTVNPGEVYLLQPRTAWVPKLDWPPTTIVKVAPQCFVGIVRAPIGEASVPMTDPAKTVVDCWKFRKLVGTETALTALRDYLKRPDASLKMLNEYASLCRVRNVMAPYIEATLA